MIVPIRIRKAVRSCFAFAALSTLAFWSCYPAQKPPPDPDLVRSELIVRRGDPEGGMLSVNGETVAWDASGEVLYSTEESADYEIELVAPPTGCEFDAFLVSFDKYRNVAEFVRSNPVRIHVEKTSVFVRPVYIQENQPSPDRSRAGNYGRLPQGIILR